MARKLKPGLNILEDGSLLLLDPPFPRLTREEIELSIRFNQPTLSDAEVKAAVEEVYQMEKEESNRG